ncbi:MAG: hypothetical protein KatS3mg111_3133 [Pirellulaceae bacterium]|nr:MAG: hypothetical protein KatS3mg111_3133 [Pirellulaceae bacterium]
MGDVASGDDPARVIEPGVLLRLRLTAWRLDRQFSFHPEPLPDEAIVPCLTSELAGQPKFAQVRLAVGANAFFFQVDVQGKRQLPWCRESRPEDSDGLHVWINTRFSADLQRANQFCHRFAFCPLGKGRKADRPFATWGVIPRATDHPPPPPDDLFAVRARLVEGRYRVVAAIHTDVLYGLDTADFPEIGLYYGVQDRELGWQALATSPGFPIEEVPALWARWRLLT